ncbi:MAG TPA: sialidase family protein, partial [Kofleriaceae bacterium]|nr:sialidase family protein [Kofleriaceae bacterium]
MALLITRAAWSLPLVAACGLGPFDDEPGGRDNLPTRAAGPYDKTELDFATAADEPYVLADVRADVRDPSPLGRDGGGFRIWYTRADPEDDSAEIWYAELPDVHSVPDVPARLALAADAGWEEGFVGEPSVIDLGGGHLVLYYRGGVAAPAIGRADSTDDGQSWQKHAGNPLVEGAVSPAGALLADRTALYFVDPDEPGIQAATAADGIAFTRAPAAVIAARPALADAFDSRAVGDPFAL